MHAQAAAYYKETPDVATLVKSHTNLVRKIAWHFKGRTGRAIEVEDLIQAGFLGLIDASQRYRPKEGVNFAAYAAIRIRGAIVDYLRRNSNLCRATIARHQTVKAARLKLERKLGRTPDSIEVAAELGIEVTEYEAWLTSFEAGTNASLDDVYSDHSDWFRSDERTAEQMVGDNEMKGFMLEALKQLPEREALVLQLYYVEELTLQEIAQVLDVTTGRVSQIKKASIQRLRSIIDELRGEKD